MGCGRCCDPGDYLEIAETIQWYIDNAENGNVKEMGMNGRRYLEEHLARDISVKRYIDAISKL